MLTRDPTKRPSAQKLLENVWITENIDKPNISN